MGAPNEPSHQPEGGPAASPPAAPTKPTRGNEDAPAASEAQRAYFDALQVEVDRLYAVARQARARGLDPELHVEIPPAKDLAARVEAQVEIAGVAERIRELTRKHGNRELVAIEVAKEVAREIITNGGGRERAVDKAVRTGLSVLTEGILVAPLEGVAEVRLGKNADGTDYVDLFFAGPIRAAGGTAQAMSVLIADVVRRELNIGRFRPTRDEVERFKLEVPLYKRAQHLQYTPTAEEIELIVTHCPISVNGEGTEEMEVPAYRDLPRVKDNTLRGGACLVIAEGMCLKAPKVERHVKRLNLEGWEFLSTFVAKSRGQEQGAEAMLAPSEKFLKELIAGRPVFGGASRAGGFRLRYGRSRTGGIASTSVHPAAMVIVEEFLAVGTQMKIERPGKATVATPCSAVEPPTVVLKSGDFVEVTTPAEAKRLLPSVQRIIDLGEILVPFGEFVENNHILPLSPYCFEWWRHDLDAAGVAGAADLAARANHGDMSPREGLDLAERTQTPLCPAFNLFWHDVLDDKLKPLGDWILERGRWEARVSSKPLFGDGVLVLPMDLGYKEVLVELGALHRVEGGALVVDRAAYPLLRGLGLDLVRDRIVEHVRRQTAWNEPRKGPFFTCELASRLAGVEIRPRGPVRIGARMGRPEKADARKMSPPPHALFPIANAGGPQRLVTDAARQGKVVVEYGVRKCPTCNQRTFRTFCDNRHHTVYTGQKERDGVIDVASELRFAKMSLGLDRIPDEIKGVMGTISESKTPEPLEKGILRAKHGIWSFKDGTARFDMTDTPLTHFRPREIGTSLEKLRALGYQCDINGRPLESADQLLELRVQDIVPARTCLDYLLKTAKFVDELLERFYKLPAYYNAKAPDDMVGHLVAGLAPHTSGAVVGRIIGSTTAQVCWAHPFFHTAKRRNCDGDEDAVMLLMDGLLNFSRVFIPAKRGGLMDLPLVLSTRLDPKEIDKEAHNVDVAWRYPREFYEATVRHAHPKEVQKAMDLVEGRLGTEAQYEGLGFTHDTEDINAGVAVSAYKTLGTMMEKMLKQLELGAKLRGVDAENVARRVLESHFLPDLMGNLKAFSRQKMRCTKCGAKYRRPPLAGVCTNEVRSQDGKPKRCGYKLILTVTEASVRKYLEVSRQIANEYNLGEYTQQRLLLIDRNVTSMFTSDKVKKAKLSDFF